ncbi:hypothetical protein [Pelomonas cellulosilytica]|uniref:Uncharacterized protein n=1 Tax=Pelomonas cellulosilytica TaxID=2906762 RepID=A0ABS8XXY5_9BURK|nr:hypothetical protein [Pelomonas sp. P8]MCE4555471.1 hypothetical protein [Pelomonas sp. P8]
MRGWRAVAWCLAGFSAVLSATAALAAPAVDPQAVQQLVSAVGLDMMSEASVEACDDIGAPSAPAMRAAWVAWRTKHDIAPLRQVLTRLRGAAHNRPGLAPWEQLTDPIRERVLQDSQPEAACAALMRDWQTPGMDVGALYPRARDGAAAMVAAELAWPPSTPPAANAPAGATLLLPSQLEALAAQHSRGWQTLSVEQARQRLGDVFVKGRVVRWSRNPDRFRLIHEQGGRTAYTKVYVDGNLEPWVGREVVLRGVATSLDWSAMHLSDVAIVTEAGALKPSTLAQSRLERPGVLLQRVLAKPGQGLQDKDVAAVVVWGEADYNNGSSWTDDVRFLLRDGTAYARAVMPPDELNATASRQLEPRQWSRWRKGDIGYELQDWDDDGKPSGDWERIKHLPARAWPAGTLLEGYFENANFSGSLMLGGTTTRRGYRFTRDGRFERSFGRVSGSGGMAAAGGAVVSASSQRDGSGSRSSAGGVAGGVGTASQRSIDDGASYRGRYKLGGYTLVLDFDDGHQERMLSFIVYPDSDKTIFIGHASYQRQK